ncbi:MAG: serine hydrolase domain-containing protein [Vicinamibacterales bacterium]
MALLLAMPALVAQGRPDDADLAARIDALVRQEADARLLSGVILVARGDRVLFQRAYGRANWELDVPNAPDTRFGVGSITKAMTQVVVDALIDERRLDLDAPVSRYLGAFPQGPRGGVVTVRHLLDHRAGVPFRVTTELEETLPLHPQEIVERVRARGLLFEPGTQELYSSAGFSCLARVVEVIEGRAFDDVLRDRIFRPASMTTATDETGQQLMPHRAMPYRLAATAGALTVASARYKDLRFLTGAGSVYATAEDLLHFVRAMQAGVLGRAARQRVAEGDSGSWRSWYGRTTGYETSVDVDPAQDLTFVFLSNLRSGANWQVREQVKRLLTGASAVAIRRPPPPADPFEAPGTFVGSYGDPSDPIVISVEDGHLFRDDSEFYPAAGGNYCLPASGFLMRFRRTGGTVDALLTDRGTGTESVALRVTPRR